MHVDTGHNFPEVIDVPRPARRPSSASGSSSRRSRTRSTGARRRRHAPGASRNRLQTTTLLDAIEQHGFDAVFGGARRDEEKARAKERVFSFRDEFGQWDPKNQRPELWNLYNGRHHRGEHIRVFPLSNWTELDIWQYIEAEEHRAAVDLLRAPPGGLPPRRDADGGRTDSASRRRRRRGRSTTTVRYRTVGDMTCTGAVESSAATVGEVIDEVARDRGSPSGARPEPTTGSREAAMEDRKREGYF